MSAKKRGGGRVTPKGTQPASTSKGKAADGDAAGNGTPWAPPNRPTQAPGRGSFGPVGHTRAGPRGGNR